MRAYAYLRVSGQAQIDGDGFPRQRLAIQKYAAEHGYEIVAEFAEEGVSGTKDADARPAWARMLNEMRDGDVKTVIVECVNRLARTLLVQEVAVADLQRQGLTVLSTMEPDLCSDDPTRVLIRQVLGAISQYDKSLIVQKLRGARERTKAARGRCEGQKPFGHYDGEKAALDEILTRRVAGQSAKRIAEELNAAGVPARKGGAWHARVISRILEANRRAA